jgi:hypothetical protein
MPGSAITENIVRIRSLTGRLLIRNRTGPPESLVPQHPDCPAVPTPRKVVVTRQRNQQAFEMIFYWIVRRWLACGAKPIALAVTGPARAIGLGEESGAAS